MDKLNIHNEMQCFDRKDRKFYQSLTDGERKKFSNYLMIRWGSSVQGNAMEQAVYLLSCNENFNKHFFAINRYPELQWLCATTVSPGWGTFKHNWIAPKKKEPAAGSTKKQLAELFPNLKLDDIDTLSKLVSKKELDQYLKQMGQDK